MPFGASSSSSWWNGTVRDDASHPSTTVPYRLSSLHVDEDIQNAAAGLLGIAHTHVRRGEATTLWSQSSMWGWKPDATMNTTMTNTSTTTATTTTTTTTNDAPSPSTPWVPSGECLRPHTAAAIQPSGPLAPPPLFASPDRRSSLGTTNAHAASNRVQPQRTPAAQQATTTAHGTLSNGSCSSTSPPPLVIDGFQVDGTASCPVGRRPRPHQVQRVSPVPVPHRSTSQASSHSNKPHTVPLLPPPSQQLLLPPPQQQHLPNFIDGSIRVGRTESNTRQPESDAPVPSNFLTPPPQCVGATHSGRVVQKPLTFAEEIFGKNGRPPVLLHRNHPKRVLTKPQLRKLIATHQQKTTKASARISANVVVPPRITVGNSVAPPPLLRINSNVTGRVVKKPVNFADEIFGKNGRPPVLDDATLARLARARTTTVGLVRPSGESIHNNTSNRRTKDSRRRRRDIRTATRATPKAEIDPVVTEENLNSPRKRHRSRKNATDETDTTNGSPRSRRRPRADREPVSVDRVPFYPDTVTSRRRASRKPKLFAQERFGKNGRPPSPVLIAEAEPSGTVLVSPRRYTMTPPTEEKSPRTVSDSSIEADEGKVQRSSFGSEREHSDDLESNVNVDLGESTVVGNATQGTKDIESVVVPDGTMRDRNTHGTKIARWLQRKRNEWERQKSQSRVLGLPSNKMGSAYDSAPPDTTNEKRLLSKHKSDRAGKESVRHIKNLEPERCDSRSIVSKQANKSLDKSIFDEDSVDNTVAASDLVDSESENGPSIAKSTDSPISGGSRLRRGLFKKENEDAQPSHKRRGRKRPVDLVVVGARVEVFWKEEQQYFAGIVMKQREHKRAFYVEYDDGDREWIDFAAHKFRLIESVTHDTSKAKRKAEILNALCKKRVSEIELTSSETKKYAATGGFHEINPIGTRVKKLRRGRKKGVSILDDSNNGEENDPEDNIYGITVGCRVAVFWEGDRKYFNGSVTRKRSANRKNFFVEYDDGDSEWIDFDDHQFRLFITDERDEVHTDTAEDYDEGEALDDLNEEHEKGDASKVSIGCRVAVYWDGDNEYYKGKIMSIKKDKKASFYLKYDDGEDEWINLRRHKFVHLPKKKSGGRPQKKRKTDFR